MDVSRFFAAFFAESREGLDAFESGLLAFERGAGTADTLNTVFRAAHSIKGGAATFGFPAIAEFTHVAETLLDGVRAGTHALGAMAISDLLAAGDALRGLIDAAEHGTAFDEAALASLRARLAAHVDGDAAPSPQVEAAAAPAPAGDWTIAFAPAPDFFATGNDPLRLLRELGALGALQVVAVDDHALPAFAALDPHTAHLAWTLVLDGAVAEAAIRDVFAWVEDVCTLTLTRAGAPVPAATAAPMPLAQTPPPSPIAEAPNAAVPARHSDGDGSIRVSTAKVDALVNLVGELVITQAMLARRSEALDPALHDALLAGIAQLERNSRDLQESVMRMRMLPVEAAFSRLPRMVRDLAAQLGKQVRLTTAGEATELDKGVMEKLVDPLVHLVRNAIDHGLELPDARTTAGKDPGGTLHLAARHQGGQIVIEVRDDGRGLDRARILAKAHERGIAIAADAPDAQVWDLVFHPGFSTAATVSAISGRGVGMDVVRSNIAALGGTVDITSRDGAGTTVTIRLPLTLAIVDGMTVAVGDEVYVLPLNVVVESLQPQASDVRTVARDARVLRLREDVLPLVDLRARFGTPAANDDGVPLAVVVEADGTRVALAVDALLGQQQVVVKTLETHYRRVPGVSGATILGDGRVALIVDAAALARTHLPAA